MAKQFDLFLADEWTAHDPMGKVKPSDSTGVNLFKKISIHVPRGGYGSFRLVVHGKGSFRLVTAFDQGLEVDLFRAWYHPLPDIKGTPKRYYPDALIPVSVKESFAIPDPDNHIPGQKVQEFWVDIYASKDTQAGATSGSIKLMSGSQACELKVDVVILKEKLPDEPYIVIDNNSYGARFIPELYPKSIPATATTQAWRTTIQMMHNYYRMAHEHRACFHNLGYGHSGQFDPIYGPRAVGNGSAKRLTDWSLFDQHYGPLLDGSVFSKASPGMPRPRRVANPIWGVYTPINPDWPADYLWWGEKGYEAEFNSCVGQFDAHFREKKWTKSRIEFFFNHKKRYRWFEWDGDEAKYKKDDVCHLEMVRMWQNAIGKSPVQWVYRIDASWRMKDQFDVLDGVKNFWVCGGFCKWYPEEIKRVLKRGDILFNYGGYPDIAAASSAELQPVYTNWARGLHGFTEWLVNSPGRDPWFACEGAANGTFYPGERFGINGPIPSIRLKIMRNGIQDIDLLHQGALLRGGEKQLAKVRAQLVEEVGSPIWQKPPRTVRELPPEEWDSQNLSTEHEPIATPDERLGPGWWATVRKQAVSSQAKNRK